MSSWITKELYASWQRSVPNLGLVLEKMNEKTIIAVGALPYPRILPALFLDNYQIYSVPDVADIDVLQHYAIIHCLEERNPKIAKKTQSTNYLLGSYPFQAFLKSRRYPFRLYFYQTTPPLIKKVEELGYDWIGNDPSFTEHIKLKSNFRLLLKGKNLPHLPDWRVPRADFFNLSFEELHTKWNKAVVVQRGDEEVGGVEGTFFIKTPEDLASAKTKLAKGERWTFIQISPFVTGHSVSMLGCITRQGVLSGPLQLQLIDVPEALGGAAATGQFLGHDWGFKDWAQSAEQEAQSVVEAVGRHMSESGFKGVFGIDFMYDTETQKLYPTECNPRSTGAMPMYSLMTYGLQQVPPIDFFHLMSHLDIREEFDFAFVNEKLKQTIPLTHISIAPFGVTEMKLSLRAGLYTYEQNHSRLHYVKPAAFPWHIEDDQDFIIIDSIPRQGASINQKVPRLFKLIFRRSIAESSYSLKQEPAEVIKKIANVLRA